MGTHLPKKWASSFGTDFLNLVTRSQEWFFYIYECDIINMCDLWLIFVILCDDFRWMRVGSWRSRTLANPPTSPVRPWTATTACSTAVPPTLGHHSAAHASPSPATWEITLPRRAASRGHRFCQTVPWGRAMKQKVLMSWRWWRQRVLMAVDCWNDPLTRSSSGCQVRMMAPLTGVLSDRFLWVWVLVQVHVSECVYERERERECCVLLRENWKTSEKAGVWMCVKERETHREMCSTQAKNSEKKQTIFQTLQSHAM